MITAYCVEPARALATFWRLGIGCMRQPPDNQGSIADRGSIPSAGAPVFRATVHGLAFDGRARHLAEVRPRGELLLIPDPPGGEPDDVWVHIPAGDPLGHLPREIGVWLAPWMRLGGSARARVLKVGDQTVPSWKRLLVEVTCTDGAA